MRSRSAAFLTRRSTPTVRLDSHWTDSSKCIALVPRFPVLPSVADSDLDGEFLVRKIFFSFPSPSVVVGPGSRTKNQDPGPSYLQGDPGVNF